MPSKPHTFRPACWAALFVFFAEALQPSSSVSTNGTDASNATSSTHGMLSNATSVLSSSAVYSSPTAKTNATTVTNESSAVTSVPSPSAVYPSPTIVFTVTNQSSALYNSSITPATLPPSSVVYVGTATSTAANGTVSFNVTSVPSPSAVYPSPTVVYTVTNQSSALYNSSITPVPPPPPPPSVVAGTVATSTTNETVSFNATSVPSYAITEETVSFEATLVPSALHTTLVSTTPPPTTATPEPTSDSSDSSPSAAVIAVIVVAVVLVAIIAVLLGVLYLNFRRTRSRQGRMNLYIVETGKDVELSGVGFAREGADDEEDPSYLQPGTGPQYSNIPSEGRELPNPCASLTESTKDEQHAYNSLHTAAPSDDRRRHNYESLDDYGRANGQSDSRWVGEKNEKAINGVLDGKATVYASIPGDTDAGIPSADNELHAIIDEGDVGWV